MKIDKNKTVFLLGGYDLEMVTIRDILLKAGCLVEDKHLSWGAKLSEYRDEIANHHDKTIYAVELEVDDEELGEEVEIIDHHNEYIKRAASIQQILDLLELNLNDEIKRRYELVAANDSGYISAMECIGATEEEIRKIREEDKKAQGVTQEDEEIGKNDAKNKKVLDGKDIAVVKAHTDRFSVITDALYFNFTYDNRQSKNIIYNDNEVIFYGFDIDRLIVLLDYDERYIGSYFYGGGEKGYLVVNNSQLAEPVREYIIKNYNDALYSTHTFMFPFRFDYIAEKNSYKREFDFYKQVSITERIDIKKLFEKMSPEWKYKHFDIKKIIEDKEVKYYSEFAYFYDYAREAIYNLQENDKSKEFFKDEISYYFEHKKFGKRENNDYYIIRCDKDKCYELFLVGVSLRIFDTGIGILSIELENNLYNSFADIKLINEYGRRFSPAYLGKDKDKCSLTKSHFLAESTTIKHLGQNYACEYFESEKILADESSEIRIGRQITTLLGSAFSQSLQKHNQFYIQPIMDDRMFVMSWYGNTEVAEGFTGCYEYANSDHWYEYVFVDKHDDVTVKNSTMRESLIKHATYDRWSKDGTLFGITRYSFVALTKSDGSWLATHTNTMYFQIMIILLATRASVLRFSDEISAVARLNDIKNEDRLRDLYERYLNFYNRLYFKEVTHQDQGIELYDMGLVQMRIPEHIAKLDTKFTKLHNYAQLKANNRESNDMNNITRLGAVFLPPSLIVGLLSMGIFDYDKSYTSLVVGLVAVGASALLGYVAVSSSKESE